MVEKKIRKKDDKDYMITIDRRQRDFLLKNGFKYGKDIHHTVGKGKKKTYFATESQKVLSCLEKIQ